ncbi:SIS domain-containing protein [Candidatus Izimaplasma bacterium ZiA1]|uniref:SIS domain-containing protein n=1 Tax=Candidatus Izimoplasma sp. ZiA1 TaxID=2024899 RepID=UPI001F0A193A
MFDDIVTEKGDLFIVISNSGRNSIPIEFALRAKKEGHKVVVLTSLEQNKQYPSRHISGKKIYEIGDYVLDNCVLSGDGLFTIDGIVTGLHLQFKEWQFLILLYLRL